MAIVSAAALKRYFEENDAPTSANFSDLIDSLFARGSAAGTAQGVAGLGAGSVGDDVFFANTTASAKSVIGAGAVGTIQFEQATTASAKSVIGAGAVGTIQFEQATTASAQTVIGGGVAGRATFEAITTASARQALDIAVATTAQMSAPTNTSSVFVTPGLQHYHPLHPKAFVSFNPAAASAYQSWNVASVALIATGIYRVTWGSAFPTDRYAVLHGSYCIAGDQRNGILVHGATAGAQRAGDCQFISTNDAGANANVSGGFIAVIDR
jgi:hypothetical protein